MRTVMLLVPLVAACASESSSSSTPAAKAAEAKPAAAATPAAPAAKPAALPQRAGLFACKAPATPPAAAPRDPKDVWALPFAVTGCPSVPPVFGTASFGMEQKAAQAAVKGSKISSNSGFLYLGPRTKRQQYVFHFDDAGKLNEFAFHVDEARFQQLAAAWGAPLAEKWSTTEAKVWFDPANQIRATASPTSTSVGLESKPGYRIVIAKYLPLAQLFGDALLAKPIVGMAFDEVATTFGDQLVVKTKEQQRAEMNRVLDAKSKEAVQQLDNMAKAAGITDPDATATIKLPPTEIDPYSTSVHLDWKDKKVASYRFSLDHNKDPKLRDEILAEITAKLGAPTASKQDGAECLYNKCSYTFAGPNKTVVTVTPGIMDDSWQVTVGR
jgi:hypothetical protein